MDIFFKYHRFPEACEYLYYRREFEDLLQLIKFEFEENKKQYDQLKSKIRKQQEPDPTKSDDHAQELTQLENQRDEARVLRNFWLAKHIEYMQKINDLCPTDIPGISEEDQLKIIEKAEDKACQKSDWVFRVNEVKWVECFKKYSNLDGKLKARKNNNEETICVK